MNHARDKEFGRRVRSARRETGLKQEELARSLEVSVFSVSRWERGVNYPEMPMLIALARRLGKPVAYFTAHLDGSAPSDGDGAEITNVRLGERLDALQEDVQRVENLLQERLPAQKPRRR